MLSVGATFAADEVSDVIAVDDEITVDEPLAVGEEDQIVSANESVDASDVVTKDTFNNYFDESGSLLANVTSDELTFGGDISDVGVDTIVLDRPIKIMGENSTINNIAIDIKASDVVISGLTINQNNGAAAISIYNASNVQIENTEINFNAVANSDGYAINADLADNLKLINNAITYAGATTGWEVNNAVRVSNSNNAIIKSNKIDARLVSAAVGWAEVPAGSGNWVSSPITEGVVIDSSDDVAFEDNNVNVTYTNVVGSYDTIYSVDFKNSNNAVIANNNIVSKGNTYIYGIIISGENFVIESNDIASSAEYYADGIDVEGVSTGIVKGNVIDVKAPNLAYGVYSGMSNYEPAGNVTYENNNITGDAYLVIGFSLSDVESKLVGNRIDVNGNFTTGIASVVPQITIKDNYVKEVSSAIGNESIWETFGTAAAGIKIHSGNAIISGNEIVADVNGIVVKDSSADLTGNKLSVVAGNDIDSYAIYAENANSLAISKNDVKYIGNTLGVGVNNAVYLTNSSSAKINENKFDISLVSAAVNWVEEPAGSGNYVGYPVTEGVLVDSSDDVSLQDNIIGVTYNNVIGYYDTIYSVDFKNSANAVIAGNEIISTGNTYIYGIIISGPDFNIANNTITSESQYYANGIDVEGPANGVVENNVISVKAPTLGYPIYSGMNNQPVSAVYKDNTLKGDAYLVIGMSLGDVESDVESNTIDITGNYTTGIASNVADITVKGNKISAVASNVGNESIWETFGVATRGIYIASGSANISDNYIKAASDYAIVLDSDNASVTNNTLEANKIGSGAIKIHTNVQISDVGPDYKVIIVASDLTKTYGTSTKFVVTVLDENGKFIANKKITALVNGKVLTATTTAKGVASFNINLNAGKYTIITSFAGDKVYASKEISNKIVVNKAATKITAAKKTFKVKTKTKKYTITLKANSKALAKVKVTIKINGKTYKATTNAKGKATFKITKLTKKGKFKAKITFAATKNYKATSKNVYITVKK